MSRAFFLNLTPDSRMHNRYWEVVKSLKILSKYRPTNNVLILTKNSFSPKSIIGTSLITLFNYNQVGLSTILTWTRGWKHHTIGLETLHFTDQNILEERGRGRGRGGEGETEREREREERKKEREREREERKGDPHVNLKHFFLIVGISVRINNAEKEYRKHGYNTHTKNILTALKKT